jgi:hypothetical protein
MQKEWHTATKPLTFYKSHGSERGGRYFVGASGQPPARTDINSLSHRPSPDRANSLAILRLCGVYHL